MQVSETPFDTRYSYTVCSAQWVREWVQGEGGQGVCGCVPCCFSNRHLPLHSHTYTHIHITHTVTRTHREYTEQRASIPKGSLVEVSFAELEADPVGTMRRIYEALG